jgi:hypothetical protein
VILDDVHRADEPSLLVLRHLSDHVAGTRLLVLATFRDVEPRSALPHVLPDLLRSPAVERLDLRGFDLTEVREQLSRTTMVDAAGEGQARAEVDVTGGNPLFVREVVRAMADGTWRPDRPPRTVLDVVAARLDRVSAPCRWLVQVPTGSSPRSSGRRWPRRSARSLWAPPRSSASTWPAPTSASRGAENDGDGAT